MKRLGGRTGRSKNAGKADSTPRGPETVGRKDALSSMRQILVTRRDALRRALAGDLSLLKELREQSTGDVVDFALDSAQDEISSQLAEVESRELASIDNALERMREGTYGLCESCNDPIPFARLQALPYAVTCIQCQREMEKKGRGGSSATKWGSVLDLGGGDSDMSFSDLEMDVS